MNAPSFNLLSSNNGPTRRGIRIDESSFYLRFVELSDRLRNAGNYSNALIVAEAACELAPSAIDALKSRASALFAEGRFRAALQICNDILGICRDDAEAMAYRADCRLALSDWHGAMRDYRRALRRNPTFTHARFNLCLLLLRTGRASESIRHCESVMTVVGATAQCWKVIALCRIQLNQLDLAMDAYAEAYAIEPDSVDLATQIGLLWRRIGDDEQTLAWLARALALDPENVTVNAHVASLLLDKGDHDRALFIYEALSARFPANPNFALGMAHALWECGRPADAIDVYDKLLHRFPEASNLHCRKAEVLLSLGQSDAAIACWQRALAIDGKSVPAITGLAMTLCGEMKRSDIRQAQRLLERKRLDENARSAIHAGLARYYDAKGNHRYAVVHSTECNKTYWRHRERSGWHYSPDAHRARVDRIIETFTPELFERLSGAGHADARPTFIVGMPRSGTTLTERILASHPQILCLGERSFASQSLHNLERPGNSPNALNRLRRVEAKRIASIAKRYAETLDECAESNEPQGGKFIRIVDKMPDNYELLGWISLLFPNARIIYVRRDPRDIALSCWMQRFAQIRWACDMNHIVARLQQHYRLMDHWRRTLSIPIHELEYETLVADTESQARRLIAFLGVEWNDKCLDHRLGPGIVRTASVTQVCKPIYRSSIDRWRHYEDLLRPVVDGLAIKNARTELRRELPHTIDEGELLHV